MLTQCSPPVMCYVSRVTCIFIFYFFLQIGGASRWSVCYQRGLPRLVFFKIQPNLEKESLSKSQSPFKVVKTLPCLNGCSQKADVFTEYSFSLEHFKNKYKLLIDPVKTMIFYKQV